MPSLRRSGIFGFAALLLAMLGFTPAATASAAPQPVIALFTDFGWEDPYVAQMKGAILTVDPTARLLDLTHTVSPYNIAEGAYLLDQSAEEFPAGTIFIAVVDPGVGTDRDPILLETSKGKFFVGPDNGLFTHVVDNEGFSRAWKLDKPEYFRGGAVSATFHGRDIFAAVAAHLASGVDPDRVGTPIKTLVMLPVKEPTFTGGSISVEVLHLDRYGNVILNLRNDGEIAAKLKEGNLVKISIGKESYSGPLVKTYGDMEKGRLILLYGGNGFLEIAMNQGSAAKELKVEAGTVIFLKP
jgi:hypothetical protein